MSQVPVAHGCNPSYLVCRHQKDHGSKPAWMKRVAQVVEHLLIKHDILNSNPSTTNK
jgi:hypothetical protein